MKPGEIINSLRIKKGYTQKELADLIEVKPIEISKIINGKTFPNKKTMMKLKKVLED